MRRLVASSSAPRVAAIVLALVVLLGPLSVGDAEARTQKRAKRPTAGRTTKAKPRPIGLVWHVETLGGDVLDTSAGDIPINPASVTKVATTLWALEVLGPQHRFETRLLTDGPATPVRGFLPGNLVVEGGRDPDFQLENALLLARELNQAGITGFRGGLVVDRAFWLGWEGGSQHREPDPVKRALVMAARLRQAFDPDRWNGSLRRAWRDLALRQGFDPARPPRVTFLGPAGQTVDGRGAPLAVHRSRPLVATLRRLNCFSNNDIERVGESLGEGRDMGRWLTARWNLPGHALSFETTSGLGENRMTPRQMVGLLRDLRHTCDRLGVPFESILPASGCDPGTVSRFYGRLAAEPAAAVIGKTGTLTTTDGGVSVFAGSASTARGEVLFAVAAPRAAGRLRHARTREEQWVLELIARNGGAVGRNCAEPLSGSDDGVLVHSFVVTGPASTALAPAVAGN